MNPEFLSLDDVLEIHEYYIERFGGTFGIRDQGLLESAIAMPQAGNENDYYHHDVFEMAAAYAYHMAQNQPFLDGNKRTGLASAMVFLEINGVVLSDPNEALYDAMIKVSERTLDKSGLADLLRNLTT